MKKLTICLALIGLLALGGQAFAVMCAVDDTPGATLLLPYFEQSLTGDGVTTLFSVNNASAAPTIAHVTVWTDWSVPVFDFDIYLTGYDVQTINMRDLLVNGNLPVTGFGVSNNGTFSDPGVAFANCGPPGPPAYSNPAISGSFLAHVQAWLTGQQSPVENNCAGSGRAGSDVATGYVTIDDTNECSLRFPSDQASVSYFVDEGLGIASNDNQLWGDYFYVDPANNFAQGDTLVHIEAEDGFQGGPNGYTFYGRYTEPGNDGTAALDDNREPLATNFAVRHILGGAFSGGTDLLVWRDSTTAAASPVTCGFAPSWFPLQTRQIVIFDEEENPVQPEGGVSGEPEEDLEPFPIEAQRVTVGSTAFPIPAGWEFGWDYLNLNHDGSDNSWAQDPASAQAWVSAIHSAEGRYSVGLDAIQLDSACSPITTLIGN